MENNPANKQEQPDLHQADRNDIGSPLNTGHQKQETTGTNDQNGDMQGSPNAPVIQGKAASQADNQSLDGRTAGGINDPRANKTPHPGETDGAPKPNGG